MGLDMALLSRLRSQDSYAHATPARRELRDLAELLMLEKGPRAEELRLLRQRERTF